MNVVCLPQYTLATDSFQLGYNAEGHCKGEVDSSLPRPQKLNWEIPPEVSQSIQTFYFFTSLTQPHTLNMAPSSKYSSYYVLSNFVVA